MLSLWNGRQDSVLFCFFQAADAAWFVTPLKVCTAEKKQLKQAAYLFYFIHIFYFIFHAALLLLNKARVI